MVKFVKNFQNYNKGEFASFTPSHEAWLIEKRFATAAKEGDNVAKSTIKDDDKDKRSDPGQPQNRQTVVPQK